MGIGGTFNKNTAFPPTAFRYKENNVSAKVIQCKIAEVGSYEDEATLLVTTTIPPREYKIPVVKALNYLINMNTAKTDKEILDALK